MANMELAEHGARLALPEIAAILHTSFWNHLLRFIVINGKEYPVNVQMRAGCGGGITVDYTNPHIENRRVSYDHEHHFIFFEKKEWKQHPFASMQRVTGDTAILCSFFGYEKFGYTNPNRKVPDWIKMGKEIPIRRIAIVKIESFWDRPKALWDNRGDYTAYKLHIKTKVVV